MLTRHRSLSDNAHPSATAWLAGFALLLFALPALAETAMGVPLPKGSTAQGEDRYQSPSDYLSTIKSIEQALSRKGIKVRFERAIDLPEVVAAHAPSPSSKTVWSGINVSRYGGKTWVFVIRRDRSL